jgi:hypothetical protein
MHVDKEIADVKYDVQEFWIIDVPLCFPRRIEWKACAVENFIALGSWTTACLAILVIFHGKHELTFE